MYLIKFHNSLGQCVAIIQINALSTKTMFKLNELLRFQISYKQKLANGEMTNKDYFGLGPFRQKRQIGTQQLKKWCS